MHHGRKKRIEQQRTSTDTARLNNAISFKGYISGDKSLKNAANIPNLIQSIKDGEDVSRLGGGPVIAIKYGQYVEPINDEAGEWEYDWINRKLENYTGGGENNEWPKRKDTVIGGLREYQTFSVIVDGNHRFIAYVLATGDIPPNMEESFDGLPTGRPATESSAAIPALSIYQTNSEHHYSGGYSWKTLMSIIEEKGIKLSVDP